jgi:hypothetical protein
MLGQGEYHNFLEGFKTTDMLEKRYVGEICKSENAFSLKIAKITANDSISNKLRKRANQYM